MIPIISERHLIRHPHGDELFYPSAKPFGIDRRVGMHHPGRGHRRLNRLVEVNIRDLVVAAKDCESDLEGGLLRASHGRCQSVLHSASSSARIATSSGYVSKGSSRAS